MEAQNNQKDDKYCDVVMKGGITSGVIYPPLVSKLSEVYKFKNIGGASAGAIAAASAAAAEYGRQDKEKAGKVVSVPKSFDELKELPGELGELGPNGSRLFNLFQPSENTKPYFNILTQFLEKESALENGLKALRIALGEEKGVIWSAFLFLAMIFLTILVAVSSWMGALWLFLAMILMGGFLVVTVFAGFRSYNGFVHEQKEKEAEGKNELAGEKEKKKSYVWPFIRNNLGVSGILKGAFVVAGFVSCFAAVLTTQGVEVDVNELSAISFGEYARGLGWSVVGFLFVSIAAVVSLIQLVFVTTKKFGKEVAQNDFGLCKGVAASSASKGEDQAEYLTDWLNAKINGLAGKISTKEKPNPLTFGDLWYNKVADLENDGKNIPASKDTNLEMMTTCLTQGRPYRMPFDNNIFYYSPTEFRTFFPADVVQWMEDHLYSKDKERGGKSNAIIKGVDDLLHLPAAKNLPVIIATRMSLSFPILLSAIPLYAIDWSREVNKVTRRLNNYIKRLNKLIETGTPPRSGPKTVEGLYELITACDKILKEERKKLGYPEHDTKEGANRERQKVEVIATRCWFSDGGITSNFPIHFFDQPFAKWPTYGVNLREKHPDMKEGDDRLIYRPNHNSGGLYEWFSPQKNEGLKDIGSFFGSMINTMQSWQDNTQAKVPGFRDRVVHISHTEDEGGLNLNMPATTIDRLASRGEEAAFNFLQYFEPEEFNEMIEKDESGTTQSFVEKYKDEQYRDKNCLEALDKDHTFGEDDRKSGLVEDALVNHKWVRFRATMAHLENLFAENKDVFQSDYYKELIDESPSHKFNTNAKKQQAKDLLEEINKLIVKWEGNKVFNENAPSAMSELRITPKT